MEPQTQVDTDNSNLDEELKNLCNLIIDCYIEERLSKNVKEC